MALRALRRCTRSTRLSSTLTSRFSNSSQVSWQPLERLLQPTLLQFQDRAFRPSIPYHLVSSFDLPAAEKWINQTTPASLNISYFERFQDEVYLPMELTMDGPSSNFTRTTAPLSLFLDYVQHMSSQHSSQPFSPRIYIAQAPLSHLPLELRKDTPTPELVLKAGKGDIYDSSVWMGPSDAARTPLHHDPNPNILVQVAGTKTVRLLPQEVGTAIFRDGRYGSLADTATFPGNGTMRGEEMMGRQGQQLDQIIWDSHSNTENAFEAILEPGDGIFIPRGWWHSIRGVGTGINISVNWWFR